MHFARIKNSPRLQRVLSALKLYGTLTTRGIIHKAGVCAVSACISELRSQGHSIECKYVRRGVYSYTLRSRA
jgi:hypothetical protein